MNFLRILPHKLALLFGRLIGRLLHLILWKKVDRCEARCVKSLGIGITLAREIIRKSFMNLGMSAVEFIRLPKIKSRISDYIDFPEESKKILRKALSRGKGVILMTSHMANWELAAAIVINSGFELHAVYTPQSNKDAEAVISDIRTNTMKMKIIDNHKSLREIFKTLKSNGIVVIMQDLDARKDGVITNFLGLPASTHDGIVKLYNKFHCPIVPVHYVRDEKNFAHHVVTMPEILSDRENFAENGLEICNEVIESWIRERPDLWLWLMDRWEFTLGKNI
ncbi:MAG: lysophospholipid acyltransferase family protein [Synergistaceae bacterium]|nr:lysophospholipid acyltransferase family protein [Synergistaceae bacterium]